MTNPLSLPPLGHLALTLLLVAAVACGGGADAEPELAECCVDALALVDRMPECCREGISDPGHLTGCCATGMLDATAEADRPECCAESVALMEDFSACCKKTVLTGDASGCCAAMPSALAAYAPE